METRSQLRESHLVDKDDPFSRLSDYVIGHHILSRLPVKEATKTCVLSRRWQKLWTYNICPRLVFSCQDAYSSPFFISETLAKKKKLELRRALIDGVNHTFQVYDKSTIDELAVCYNVGKRNSPWVDKCLEFAFRKGVGRLELDFTCSIHSADPNIAYVFLSKEKLVGLHALCDDHLHQPVYCAGMCNLRDVCLKNVDISSEVMELMLSHCPIEHLCVWGSELLQELMITEKSVQSKSVEFVECPLLKLAIWSLNLVSLKYIGYHTMLFEDCPRLILEHVPLLSEFSIGGEYCQSFLRGGAQNFGYISQLKKLTLDIDMEAMIESITYSLVFPELVTLEQLEITMYAYDSSCVLWPIILIKAAPFLQRFSVQVKLLQSCFKESGQFEDEISKLEDAIGGLNHQELKVIEMKEFTFKPRELELGKHLIGVSHCLEEFVVAVAPHLREYRKRANEFFSSLPEGANLVVL